MAFPANIEQWLLIDTYENYQVSSFGRVRNSQTGRLLKHCLNSRGYNIVGLCKK